MKTISDALSRLRFTVIMLIFLIFTALLTNTIFQEITRHWINRTGFSTSDLWYMRVERIFTSALITSGTIVFWEALFFIGLFVGLAEWITGWKQTAATFWGVHLFSLLLFSLIITIAIDQLRMIGFEASAIARDVGPSAGYFSCLGLVSARLKRPWQFLSGIILLLFFMIALFIPAIQTNNSSIKFSADMVHLIAFPSGWISSYLIRIKNESKVS